MRIAIVGHFNFPDGTAAASRVGNLAEGLARCGNDVSVMSMVPRKTAEKTPGECRWESLRSFRYLLASGWYTPRMRQGRLRKAASLLSALRQGVRRTLVELEVMRTEDGLDAVIGYSKHYTYMRPILRYCKRNGVLLVRDVVEWMAPESFVGGRLSPLHWTWYLDFHRLLPQSDAIIGISKLLTERFSSIGIPSICIPAIIDPDHWTVGAVAPPPRHDSTFHLTYLGDMANRDGPRIMMHAIQHLIRAGHDVFFDVVGSAGVGYFGHDAKALAESAPMLRGRVKFWGRVSDDDVRAKLAGSDALLFSRVSGRAAQAAFPTRLPEYLMSGRPVIASAVGDIPWYLEDGREVFLVAPDSSEALAAGVLRVMDLPDRGRSIGEAGRDKCRECFDYRSRCRQISEFLAHLRLRE